MSTIPRKVLLVVLCWLWVFEPAAAPPADPRDGYERTDFTTATRSLQPVGKHAADDADSPSSGDAQLGLPPPIPQVSAQAAALGQRLFFDRRLSFNDTLSCAMCHVPEQGFSQNEMRTPVGIEGRTVTRNAPTLLNVYMLPVLFHDGRERDLETQIWSPLLAANEMGNPSIGYVLDKLERMPEYTALFASVFGGRVDMDTLGRALAAYQQTLIAGGSPFDRWAFAGEEGALSPSAQRGYARFRAYGCVACHAVGTHSAAFTDHEFNDTGIAYYQAMLAPVQPSHVTLAPGVTVPLAVAVGNVRRNDLGRYAITRRPGDRWKFRTPSLRNAALTAPYMHDGSLSTLGAVLDYYARGGTPHAGQDERIKPFAMTPDSRTELIEFLQSLTSPSADALAREARRVAIGER